MISLMIQYFYKIVKNKTANSKYIAHKSKHIANFKKDIFSENKTGTAVED